MNEYTRNAGDPEDVTGAGRQERKAERRRLLFYKDVLSTPSGRAVFWDLLASTGLYESSMSSNGSVVFFNEGRRNVGLKLRADLERADEMAVEIMEREARQRKHADQAEAEARHTPRAEEVAHG